MAEIDSNMMDEIEKQRLRNIESRAGIPLETHQKPSKKSIMESIKIITQEMVIIATLKEAIANWLKLDDFADYYEEEHGLTGFCLLLGRLEMSLIRRKQSLNEDRKALLELTE